MLKYEVHFHDGTKVGVRADSATTVQELAYKIISKKGIANPRGFALFTELNGILRVTNQDERITDEIGDPDRFPVSKKLKKSTKPESVRLLFQLLLFLDVKVNFAQYDDITLRLVYCQVLG